MPAPFDPNLWKFTDLEGEAYEELQAKRQVYWEMICPTQRGAGWKEEIDAVIPEEHFASCDSASIWWTGCGLYIETAPASGYIRVTSPGYYETIGA